MNNLITHLKYRILLQYHIVKNSTFKSFYSGKQDSNPETEPEHILIGATTLLGDLVMTAPLVMAVRNRHKNALIDILVRPEYSKLASDIKGVDNAIAAKPKDPGWISNMVRKSRENRWDLGLIAMESRLIPLFYAIGVKKIISYPDPKGRHRSMIDNAIKLPDNITHFSNMLLKLYNCQKQVYQTPHFRINKNLVQDKIKNIKYAVIHMGASSKTKAWPIDNYIEIASYLITKQLKIVLTGINEHRGIIEKVYQALPENKVFNFCGLTHDLRMLASILESSVLTIGPDTGVLHLAKAVNTDTICLFGPSQSDLYGAASNIHFMEKTHILTAAGNLPCRNKNTIMGYRIGGISTCTRSICPPDIKSPCIEQITICSVKDAITKILGHR